MINYKIVKDDPTDWKILQLYTSDVLKNCGYDTTTEKTIDTVRGSVEVDVYGEKKGAYKTRILCECKYWNSSIPKAVIHGFRTVVEDSGANHGIIISKIGFQKGSYEAVKKANISLFTWAEFQDAFKMEYLYNIIDRNFKKGYELRRKEMVVLEIHHKHTFVLNDEEFNAFQSSREAYSNFVFYSFKEHYQHFDTREITVEEVERGISVGINDLGIKVSCLKDYFDFIYLKCQEEVEKVNLLMLQVENKLNQKIG